MKERDPETWRDLLGAAGFRLAEQLSIQLGETLDSSATRVFGAAHAQL